MALTLEQVRHVALLARLELSPEEETTFAEQLGDILEYVALLEEAETSGVEPTASVVETENLLRDDRVVNRPQVDRLLANAPERDGDHFKVPKIIE